MIRLLSFVLLSASLLLLNGCGKGSTPEEQHAEAEYTRATDLLAHGHYMQGRNLLLETLAMEKDLGRTARVGEQQQLLGNVYAEAAAFDSALFYYQQAIESFREVADRRAIRNVTIAIARVYRMQGDERKAYTLLLEALRYARVFKEEEGIRDIEWAMLPSVRALDERDETDRILKDLMTAYTASSDAGQQARVYYEAGLAAEQRGEYETATQSMQSAVTLSEQVQDSTLATAALLRLGMLYQAAGNIQEAFQRYTIALQRVDRLREGHGLRFELLTRVGNAYLRANQPGEAERFYRAALSSALALGNKIGEGYTFIQLGHCTGDREAAVGNFRSALELFNSMSYAPGASYAMRSLAALAWRDNMLSDASQTYRDALSASEGWLSRPSPDDLYAECERAALGSAGGPAYDDLIELLLQTGRSEEAFRYIDRKNGTENFRVMGALAPQVADAGLSRMLQETYAARGLRIGAEHQLSQLLLEAPRHAEAIGIVYRVLQQSGSTLSERAASVVHVNRLLGYAVGSTGATLTEVQQALPANAALVTYAPTARTLYVLVARKDRLVVQPAALERSRLQTAAREYVALLMQQETQSDSLQPAAAALRQLNDLSGLLYGALIRPVERELAGTGGVYVVLPFDIPSIPLHALRRSTPRNSPYAVERFFFHYLPQAQTLVLSRPSAVVAHEVVGLGHPGQTSWDVEYELRDIRAFFKEARLYFGAQASLSTLQKEHGDLLAVAADVRFNAAAPGNSAIYLSDPADAEITRRISLGDLMSVGPFSSVLVSELAPERLSIHPAEPLIFSGSTGAGVVMNSYVPSRKTKKFFGEMFYTALLSGLSTDAALRQAQLEMIRQKEYAAPWVWGGWFYWGR